MHQRFLPWFLACFLSMLGMLHAQAPGTASAADPITGGAERVLVARVTGTVRMTVNGQTSDLRVDDRVPAAARIVTGQNASVVLVFSNGATTQLGADTELVIEEFLQDPFASTVRVAEMQEEPSRSRTRLALNRGELVGNVKKLRHSSGSSFTVVTPVGAAGIRGTTFRIVFRPTGSGQAFGGGAQQFQFSITTLEGDVGFQTVTPGAPITGTTSVGGVAVPTGQEIAVVVTVTQNPSGQFVVTAPPQITGTTAIPPATAALITGAAQQILAASTTTSFAPPPPVNVAAPPPTPPPPRTTPLTGDR